MYDLVAYHIWPEYRTIYYINVTLIDSNQQILWGNPSFSKGTFPGYPIAPSGSERVRVTFQVCCQPTLLCKKWETVSSVHASLLVWYVSNVKDLRVEALSAWKCEQLQKFCFQLHPLYHLNGTKQPNLRANDDSHCWCQACALLRQAQSVRSRSDWRLGQLIQHFSTSCIEIKCLTQLSNMSLSFWESRLKLDWMRFFPVVYLPHPLSKSLIILIYIQMSFRFCQHIPACFILRALSGLVAGLGRGEELSK